MTGDYPGDLVQYARAPLRVNDYPDSIGHGLLYEHFVLPEQRLPKAFGLQDEFANLANGARSAGALRDIMRHAVSLLRGHSR